MPKGGPLSRHALAWGHPGWYAVLEVVVFGEAEVGGEVVGDVGEVRGVSVAGSGHMRCGSRHFPLRVRKNERTCDAGRAVWPICVPRPDKNADRKRYSPGPGTEMSGTCGTTRPPYQQRNSPPHLQHPRTRPPGVRKRTAWFVLFRDIDYLCLWTYLTT